MNKSGFSLIEMLISSALILFLLSGATQLIMTSLVAKRNAEFQLTASSLAASKLEYFKSLPFEDPALKKGEYSEAARIGFSKEILLCEWRIADIDERMKKVVIKISRQKSSQKKVALVLLFCRDLEF
ncbi:MAG: prepilin-type N-terminal cleavage/methylation domain-containing protein [Clostridiales bacterium]|nr:prepilin-type N-terminal cleavage/methylation domain-containing protein [Clostridiales bacterium]